MAIHEKTPFFGGEGVNMCLCVRGRVVLSEFLEGIHPPFCTLI